MKTIVYDNKGETWDRYTVIIGGSVYAMSKNPQDPSGFNQFACMTSELVTENNPLLGARCQLAHLPKEVRQAIRERKLNN
jgi:hypothetical protein